MTVDTQILPPRYRSPRRIGGGAVGDTSTESLRARRRRCKRRGRSGRPALGAESFPAHRGCRGCRGQTPCGVPKFGSACKSARCPRGHRFWHPTAEPENETARMITELADAVVATGRQPGGIKRRSRRHQPLTGARADFDRPCSLVLGEAEANQLRRSGARPPWQLVSGPWRGFYLARSAAIKTTEPRCASSLRHVAAGGAMWRTHLSDGREGQSSIRCGFALGCGGCGGCGGLRRIEGSPGATGGLRLDGFTITHLPICPSA